MAKLHSNELEKAQAKYAQEFWQAKLDKLPAKYSKDPQRLLGKVTTDSTDDTTVETTPAQNWLTDEALQMIKDLQDQVNKLKSQNEKKDPKAEYDWPKLYSYKLRNGKAVLGYTSKKINPSYWFTHKNAIWQVVSNQAISLVLYNFQTRQVEEWETVVEVNQFNLNSERSEKVRANKTDVNWKVWYTFNVEGHEFTVLESIVN